jgi:cytochrome c-type biogenesis protein CcmH/NrfG
MVKTIVIALLALCVTVGSAFADGGGGGGGGGGPTSPPADASIAAAQARIQSKDWSGAADTMRQAIARDPRNADYHNLLAYSIRKGANPDMDLVFKEYQEALRLDPKHLGAHEYIGEAYLMVGDLAKAKEHLAALDKLCFLSCSEYRDLKRAIQRYEAGKKP